jgi:ABC-type multidrug transport system ATPase subunit/ABC-type multidrug transport system permease subunit
VKKTGLYWKNLSVQTVDGVFLLHDFCGNVENGHICGILGPSGAGKSTTLSALGGTISSSSRSKVSGEIFYYEKDICSKESLKVQGGYVAWMQQQDTFFEMLSVEETLQLAAFLELPEHSLIQRRQRVASVMESLGLVKLKNRKIGKSASHNSLSGGEKRRLSLALELISVSKLFLADEPTSGLDSTMSKKVVGLLKKLAVQRDIPCLFSMHQPQSSIFKMLDTLILLGPGGFICYHGKASEALSYFERLGFLSPPQTNPAEFLLDLVSIDSEDTRQASKDELRVSQLAASFAESQRSYRNNSTDTRAIQLKVNANTSPSTRAHHCRTTRRFGRLLLRSWRQNIRNHRVNVFRLFASCGNAYLFTRIFHSIKKGIFNAKSVADRVALLSFSVINMSMMTFMKTVDLYAKEKPVVQREQHRNRYTSLEYLLAKILAEIPLDTVFAAIFTFTLKFSCGLRIGLKALTGVFALMTAAGATLGFAIGSLSPTGEIAVVAGIPTIVIMMAVGIINPAGVDQSEPQPVVVRILKELSPISYAIKALCLAEYRGMEFENSQNGEKQNIMSILGRSRRALKELPKMGALALVQNGDQVLNELGLKEESYKGAMKHLAILSVGNLFLSWIGLTMHTNLRDSSFDSRKGYVFR